MADYTKEQIDSAVCYSLVHSSVTKESLKLFAEKYQGSGKMFSEAYHDMYDTLSEIPEIKAFMAEHDTEHFLFIHPQELQKKYGDAPFVKEYLAFPISEFGLYSCGVLFHPL